jgi:HEAT repeat protein
MFTAAGSGVGNAVKLYRFIGFGVMFFVTCVAMYTLGGSLFAQDPSWHRPPGATLSANSAEVVKELLVTKDETYALKILEVTETDNQSLRLKMFAYKQLGKYGTKKSVPAIAERLFVEKEGFYARYALETIPDKEADEALANAAKKTNDPATLAGILTSLGVRSQHFINTDKNIASSTAKQFLTHANEDVRKAAAYTYALTADESAIDFFTQKTLDPTQADSAFLLAEILTAKGAKDKAIKIYDALAAADIYQYQRESAVYNGILSRGVDGVGLLTAQLKSDVTAFFEVGLKAGRELTDDANATVTKAMLDQLDKEKNIERKAKLVRSIGDRKSAASKKVSLPQIAGLAKSADVAVRIAAIDSLRNIGDASVLPILIDAANQTASKEIAQAAKNTLTNLPGREIDAAIVKLLDDGDVDAKIIAITLIKERRIFTASESLRKALSDSNEKVSNAAVDALGQISGLKDLPMLIDLMINAASQAEADKILIVLKSACTRFPQEAASNIVVTKFIEKNARVNTQLLNLLMEIGGRRAMEIVNSYVWGDDAELRDKATEILGKWRSPRDLDLIADACLKLAKESKETTYKIRGLKGYIRLARQFDMPEDRRLKICQEVYDLTDRNEIRILIFDVYARNPKLKFFEAAAKHLDNEAFKKKAEETLVIIGEKTQDKGKQIADTMKKIIEQSTNNDIKERAKRVLDKQ